jgi:hypothetical protein
MRYNVYVTGLLYARRMALYLISKKAACSPHRRNTVLIHTYTDMQCIWL